MELIRQWQAMRRFRNLPRADRLIVFYSEGPAYWVHFQPIIHHLTRGLARKVCYVSSSPEDPGLHQNEPGIIPFAIGDRSIRTLFFSVLDCGIMVMTMTDLGNLQIKRSGLTSHYAYVFHSLVSTHMIYRTRAFDHYDSILCCGPHQMDEFRETETVWQLPPRQLFEHGYGRLDSLLAERSARPQISRGAQKRILMAPSWGPNGLFESGTGEALTDLLLEAGYHVTARPHPETLLRAGSCWTRLVDRFRDHPKFDHEEDVGSQDSLHRADLMISDWSGAALEFFLALERPVLFVDVPRKINNPDYTMLKNVPLEISARGQIGAVVSPERLEEACGLAGNLCDAATDYAERARRLRRKWVFNVTNSGVRGAEILLELAERCAADRMN